MSLATLQRKPASSKQKKAPCERPEFLAIEGASRLSGRARWTAPCGAPILAVALLMSLWATSGCRRCDWPQLLQPPDNPVMTERDWSSLKLTVTEVYVSRHRCSRGERRTPFLAIGLDPLPVEFWDAGGMLVVSVNGQPERGVLMQVSQRKTIYLRVSRRRFDFELDFKLRGPEGEVLSEHHLSVDDKTLERRRVD